MQVLCFVLIQVSISLSNFVMYDTNAMFLCREEKQKKTKQRQDPWKIPCVYQIPNGNKNDENVKKIELF